MLFLKTAFYGLDKEPEPEPKYIVTVPQHWFHVTHKVGTSGMMSLGVGIRQAVLRIRDILVFLLFEGTFTSFLKEK